MISSIADLTSLSYSARRSVELKTQIADLTQELSSGRVKDVSRHLGSDLGVYAEIESRFVSLSAYEGSAAEATLLSDAMQSTVSQLSETSNRLSRDFLSTASSGLPVARDQLVSTAQTELDMILSSLNMTIAGRSVFAGIDSEISPLEDGDTLLTALRTEVSGAASVSDVISRVDAWFDDPAGFDAVMYNASAVPRSGIPIAENTEVAFDLLGNDPAFKLLIKQTAIGALSGEAGISLTSTERLDLIKEAGVAFLSASTELAKVSGEVGALQARIETARTQNSSTRAALEIGRSDLIASDPFDVAVRLEGAQTQLESLFAVTARSARISLTNYL